MVQDLAQPKLIVEAFTAGKQRAAQKAGALAGISKLNLIWEGSATFLSWAKMTVHQLRPTDKS